MNILFFLKALHVCFFMGFCLFFNTLCGERMSSRTDESVQFRAASLEPLADFCDVHDEDASTGMKETKEGQRSPDDCRE